MKRRRFLTNTSQFGMAALLGPSLAFDITQQSPRVPQKVGMIGFGYITCRGFYEDPERWKGHGRGGGVSG